jgi:RNA polymerase sigma-70 factor, ECF subfamily
LRERAPARAPPAAEYQANGINGGWVTDRATIERARQGDRAAQRALYEDHVDRVYRVAFRLAGDEDLARDFTQEAFVRAFQRLEEFRGDSAFSTWLHTIVVSVSLNGLRKVKRLRTRETVLEDAEALGVSTRQVDPDLRDRLYRAIDALPQGYRTVFVLHDVEGYTHEEIGQMLGIQAGTSKAQLFRARGRLRESLAAFAGAWTA